MAQLDIKELARIGAQARLRELEIEIETIYSVFPDLRGSSAPASEARDGREGVVGRARPGRVQRQPVARQLASASAGRSGAACQLPVGVRRVSA